MGAIRILYAFYQTAKKFSKLHSASPSHIQIHFKVPNWFQNKKSMGKSFELTLRYSPHHPWISWGAWRCPPSPLPRYHTWRSPWGRRWCRSGQSGSPTCCRRSGLKEVDIIRSDTGQLIRKSYWSFTDSTKYVAGHQHDYPIIQVLKN